MNQAATLTQHEWQAFLHIDTLTAKAGCTRSQLPAVAVKELADNAADASGEKAIEVECQGSSIVIRDFGPGMTPEQAVSIFDVKRPMASSKYWRRAQRGALGNGSRVVAAVLHVLDGHLVVESHGVGQRLTVDGNGITNGTERFDSDITEGTRITLALNCDLEHCMEYATVPQQLAGLSLEGAAHASWFPVAALAQLQHLAPCMSIAEFAAHLATKGVDDSRSLSDISAGELSELLGEHSTEEPKLVKLPRNTFEGQYVEEDAKIGAMPIIIQVWATAEKAEAFSADRVLLTNRAKALSAPSISQSNRRIRVELNGCSWPMGRIGKKARETAHYHVTIHLTSPFFPITTSGKALDYEEFGWSLVKAIDECIWKAGKKIPKGKKLMDLNAAAFLVMEQAYNLVSNHGEHWAHARQIMYQARPRILKMTGVESFNDNTFTQNWLPDFIEAKPKLTENWRVAYDARGNLHEPHTGRKVGMGTVSVHSYLNSGIKPEDEQKDFQYYPAGVEHRMSGLLFVEKEGFTEAFKESRLLERYDVGLASTKGMSVIAVRALIDECAGRCSNFKVYTLTDFDISGQRIRDTLTKDSRRYEFLNEIDVIDLGINWELARKLHYLGFSEPAKVSDKHSPDRVFDEMLSRGLPEEASRFLAGSASERPMRVEINALTTEELLQLVDAGLEAYFEEKVIPDNATLLDAHRRQVMQAHLDEARKAFRPHLPDTLPPGARNCIKDALDADPELSWDEALAESVPSKKARSQTGHG